MARVVGFALACFMLSGAMVEAAQKTALTVTFVLEAYRDEFSDQECDEVEKHTAELIVTRLREHVPFLEFTTNQGSDFSLTVTLRKSPAPGQPQAPREVGFYFKLEGARIQVHEEYVVFRPPHDLGSIPLVDGFIQEIDLKLTEDIYRGRLRSLLHQVPISKTGEVVSDPAGWVIPYKWSDICMEKESLLRIEHVVTRATVVLSPVLSARANGVSEGQIFCSPVNPTEFSQQLGAVSPDNVSVNLIWVTDYRDLVPCSPDYPN